MGYGEKSTRTIRQEDIPVNVERTYDPTHFTTFNTNLPENRPKKRRLDDAFPADTPPNLSASTAHLATGTLGGTIFGSTQPMADQSFWYNQPPQMATSTPLPRTSTPQTTPYKTP